MQQGGALQTTIGIIVNLVEGVYTWFWNVVDLANNFITTQVTPGNQKINIDKTNPMISIVHPSKNNHIFNSQIGINYTLTQVRPAQISSCWYYNTTGGRNSLTCGQNISGINWAQGLNNVTIYVNDTAGNTNSSFRNFSIDTIKHQISIINPINTNYSNAIILVNISASDSNLRSIWFTNASGINETYTSAVLRTFNQGTNTLYVYANDSYGNINSSNVSFFVYSILPIVQFVTPTLGNGSLINRTYTDINVTASDTNSLNINSKNL